MQFLDKTIKFNFGQDYWVKFKFATRMKDHYNELTDMLVIIA